MYEVGYAPVWVRYAQQKGVGGCNTRVERRRVRFYTGLLVALVTAWAWGVTTRSPLIVDVLRDLNALYRSGSDGRIENGYTVKLVNKVADARSFTIDVESKTPGIVLRDMPQPVRAQPEEVLSLPVVLSAPASVKDQIGRAHV